MSRKVGEAIIVEEHGGVLPVWWRERMRGATVVTLDAHLDLRPIEDHHIEALRRCTSEASLAALEKPNCWMPGDAHAYDLEDFLYAAWRLGLVDRIVRVARAIPSCEPLIEHLRLNEGAEARDLDQLQYSEGGVELHLYDVPVRMCDVAGLDALALPERLILDIDLDFFVEDQQHPWTSVDRTLTLLEPLRERTAVLTIARSVNSGFHPLRYRHYAEHIQAWWTGDAEARAHFARLERLDERARAGEDVLDPLEFEARHFPDCPATHLLRSVCDPVHAEAHRERAAALEPAYRPSAARDAAARLNQRIETDADALHRLGERLARETATPLDRGWGHTALALLYLARGDVDHGRHHYLEARSRGAGGGLLALSLGEAYLRAGESRRAQVLIRAALHDDRCRGRAALLLGNSCIKQERYAEAEPHLAVASARFGLWDRPSRMLAQLRAALGDAAGAAWAADRAARIHTSMESARQRCQAP